MPREPVAAGRQSGPTPGPLTRPDNAVTLPTSTLPGSPAARGRMEARRLRDPIGVWRRIRSMIELLVTTVVLGLLLAGILAAAIGAIVLALQHALNG